MQKVFQLTRSRGAWLTNLLSSIIRDNFNSHAHVERDFCRFCYLLYLNYFNSHAHVERDKCRCHLQKCKLNFNSHAHVERDNADETKFQEIVNFNSHAHVERDKTTHTHHLKLKISTHTLTWSVTYRSYHVTADDWISTHTLTWSVTWGNPYRGRTYRGFQLTRSRGAWHKRLVNVTNSLLFQLTRSRGAWRHRH